MQPHIKEELKNLDFDLHKFQVYLNFGPFEHSRK